MHPIVGGDGVYLLLALKFSHRGLGNENGMMTQLGVRFYATELTGTQKILRIGKRGCDADGAGLRIHLAIYKCDVPLALVFISIGKGQREWNVRGSPQQVAIPLRGAMGEGQILAVTDGEIDLDRIELRDRGEDRLGIHKIAYLHGGLTGDT